MAMIVSVTLENWMSFRDPVTFSMVAGRERQHGSRVPKVRKYPVRLLPVAAIYGGNASGKTNFFRGLSFAKRFVTDGLRPGALIPVEPYRLDPGAAARPTWFVFELLIDETIYEFAFAVTEEAVTDERLVRVTSAGERTLYERCSGQTRLEPPLSDEASLRYAAEGTRDNQLFLTNAVSQKIEAFAPVYDWFRDGLRLVAPDSRYEAFEQFIDEDDPLAAQMNDVLAQVDTGIVRLGGEETPLSSIRLPDPLRTELLEKLAPGDTARLIGPTHDDRLTVSRRGSGLVAKRLVTYHRGPAGDEVQMSLVRESDGSRRVIDLLPALLDLASSGSKRVYVIDEIDRSMHTLLTRRLLEHYLGSCSAESRSQLLFTTHDVLLMDQDLLRRDEMWVAERDGQGVSTLISFAEYKGIRYDKDIRKSYLQGRLGGVPRILLTTGCPASETGERGD